MRVRCDVSRRFWRAIGTWQAGIESGRFAAAVCDAMRSLGKVPTFLVSAAMAKALELGVRPVAKPFALDDRVASVVQAL